MKDKQPAGKEYFAWALFNWGNPWGTFSTRRDAIKHAVYITNEPWAKCRKYCSVVKATVTPWGSSPSGGEK